MVAVITRLMQSVKELRFGVQKRFMWERSKSCLLVSMRRLRRVGIECMLLNKTKTDCFV
jgi:hypothetical protein